MIKAIIFDFDGVLIDSSGMLKEVYHELSKRFNIDGLHEAKKDLDNIETDYRETLKKFNITDPEMIKVIRGEYREIEKKMKGNIVPFPCVESMLKELKKNFRLAIVSNNLADNISGKLKEFGLREYFDEIVGAEINKLKPDPTQILVCLERMNVNANEAIYIGDMDGDIIAARNAKLAGVVAVTYGFHSREKLLQQNPSALCDSPAKLAECINNTFKND